MDELGHFLKVADILNSAPRHLKAPGLQERIDALLKHEKARQVFRHVCGFKRVQSIRP